MAPLLLPPRAEEDEQAVDVALDLEALIREARARQRRRRRRVAAALAAVCAAVGSAVAAIRVTSGGRSEIEHIPGGPVVNPRAFGQHGRLAFVSRNTVWVLDGTDGSLHRIARRRGLYPLQPLFSADGRWLAYLQTTTAPAYVAGGATHYGRLWVARGDGTQAHPVPGLADATLIGWSPHSDVLAVAAGPISTRVPYGVQTTVRLVTPDGANRLLLRTRFVRGGVWSPDGKRLAIVSENPRLVDTLAVYPVAGGKPRVWRRFHPHDRLNGMSQILVDPAGWWPRFGIGLWVYGNGMTHNNDQTPLDVISAPGAPPRFLANTLSDGTTRVVAAAVRTLAIVADVSNGVNGGRLVWDAKQLQTCTATSRTCVPALVDRSTVTLDPAWSPDGRTLAFVEAPDLESSGWRQALLERWYAQHRLRLLDVRTRRVRTVVAARGATVPAWSRDGKSLLYIADDGLWLLPALESKPVEIAAPLFNRSFWPAYYGQMAWPAQFAWWSS